VRYLDVGHGRLVGLRIGSSGCRVEQMPVSVVTVVGLHGGHRAVGGNQGVCVLSGAYQSFVDVSSELELRLPRELRIVCPLLVGFFGLGEGMHWE